MQDPRFYAREVVNRQIHAMQQNARLENAPFGSVGGRKATPKKRRPRAPINTTPYKLRDTNAQRLRDETINIRNHMPIRSVIRTRLIKAFHENGMEQLPKEIIDISEEIINNLISSNNKIREEEEGPRFTTQYFVKAPRKPRAKKERKMSSGVKIEEVLEPADNTRAIENAMARIDKTKKELFRDMRRGKVLSEEQKEKMRIGRKRAAMARKGNRYITDSGRTRTAPVSKRRSVNTY